MQIHHSHSPSTSERVEYISRLIIENLNTMVETSIPDVIFSKRKAINTILPYAIYLEQGGQQEMVDAVINAARASNSMKFTWHHVVRYISRLFEKSSPTSLDRLIALISPYVPWHSELKKTRKVSRWAAAVSSIPYTEETAPSVVDALLQIACTDYLRPHVPIEIWEWLKRRPSLPPVCKGRSAGGNVDLVVYVRGLGDIELFKSYLLLIWSGCDYLRYDSFDVMKNSIMEDFGGIGREGDRQDLAEQLDHVLGELDLGLEYLKRYNPRLDEYRVQETKKQYTKLKEVLPELDREVKIE